MKQFFKKIIKALADILTFPLYVTVIVSRSNSLFIFFGQMLSLVPGSIGSFFRIAYYRKVLTYAPSNMYIGFGSYFSHREVHLGCNVYIGAYCIIGMASIGNNTLIASRVSILSGRHQHSFLLPNIPIQNQRGCYTSTYIGENCWLGEGSIVMEDIGNHCIVGAGSVVTKSFGDNVILAGNPAKLLRELPHDR